MRQQEAPAFDLWLKRSLTEQFGALLREQPSDVILQILNASTLER